MGYAAQGLRRMLLTEHNAWIHAAATVVVAIAGLLLRINRGEWCVVVLAMMAVWTAEAMNTAFELLCDVASPGVHPMVERAKDVAAGGVLLSAIGAAVIGAIVFIPHLWALR